MVARVVRIFEIARTWRKKPHTAIEPREVHLRAHVDAFFAFVEIEYERVEDKHRP